MPNVTVLNTSSNLSGATIVTRENAYTVTGLLTFDRDPSAPFAVSASSAVVPNLDADKLDGLDGASYVKTAASNTITGATQTLVGTDAADGNTLVLKSGHQTVVSGDILSSIQFESTDPSVDGTGVVAEIQTKAAASFTGSTRSTDLVFLTAVAATVAERMRLGSTGLIFPVVSHAGGNNCDVGQAVIVSFTGTPTGIAGGTAGRVLLCFNNTGGDLILSEEDVASSAANRFAAITGMSIDWRNGGVIGLVYNGTTSRWYVIGTSI